jgi:hypothetical protein
MYELERLVEGVFFEVFDQERDSVWVGPGSVLGCRSNYGELAWPGQAKGAVPPRRSFRTFAKGQILSADIVIAHWTAHEPPPRFPTMTAGTWPHSFAVPLQLGLRVLRAEL